MDVIHIQTTFGETTTVKILISTLAISTALLAPVATCAATTNAPAVAITTAATAPAAKTDETNAKVAMTEQHASRHAGIGLQANDNGLARIQEQTRQLGATN